MAGDEPHRRRVFVHGAVDAADEHGLAAVDGVLIRANAPGEDEFLRIDAHGAAALLVADEHRSFRDTRGVASQLQQQVGLGSRIDGLHRDAGTLGGHFHQGLALQVIQVAGDAIAVDDVQRHVLLQRFQAGAGVVAQPGHAVVGEVDFQIPLFLCGLHTHNAKHENDGRHQAQKGVVQAKGKLFFLHVPHPFAKRRASTARQVRKSISAAKPMK